MPFADNVVTACDADALDDQIVNKINEIAGDGGRGSHGPVMFTDQTTCNHWRAGDYRIFGTFAVNTFSVIGWGQHTGKGNSSYKVYLCAGGTTKASTT